ncbi:YhcN/YlaJ family sporulation lipoprotein [Evansella sp. LMS18]|uniref:YhcN/YlaJ family sporulation lipoprotein n=1 Tax=Evansella sp. LMS18 TaxID=2924033 RepID=UPI0020D09E2D|nr:YhcN/YlaJ family sporulation lipoprotein [Evansella sp. LMS18]UTR11625.1 YhcN/YlaJ family sporulation lipoprotein [Evansella sp. LMS18]
MKKGSIKSMIGLLCLSFAVTGCGAENNAGGAQGQQFDLFQGYQQPDSHFVINRRANSETDKYNRFGFDHQTRDTALSGQEAAGYAVYDKSLMAQTISQMAALNPYLNEVAVLVTDQHVLMAYDTPSEDREYVATQVKKTALSIVPAYFDVYVADNPGLIQDIKRFQGLSPREPEYAQTLEQTIEEMKEYPQGEDVDLNPDMLQDTEYETSPDSGRRAEGHSMQEN